MEKCAIIFKLHTYSTNQKLARLFQVCLILFRTWCSRLKIWILIQFGNNCTRIHVITYTDKPLHMNYTRMKTHL